MGHWIAMNTCYECGSDIPLDVHFCDTICGKRYVDRYGEDRFRIALGRQTKLRKRLGLQYCNKKDAEPEESGMLKIARTI